MLKNTFFAVLFLACAGLAALPLQAAEKEPFDIETGEGYDAVSEGLMTEINPEWFDTAITMRDDAILAECFHKGRGGAVTGPLNERQSNNILLCLRGYGMTSFSLPTSFYRPQHGGMPKDPVTGEALRLPISEDMQRDVIQGTKTYAKPPPRKDIMDPMSQSPAAVPTPEQPAAPVAAAPTVPPDPVIPAPEKPAGTSPATVVEEKKAPAGPAKPSLYIVSPPAGEGDEAAPRQPGQLWISR